jgi:type IV pilus assembly protein PilQ
MEVSPMLAKLLLTALAAQTLIAPLNAQAAPAAAAPAAQPQPVTKALAGDKPVSAHQGEPINLAVQQAPLGQVLEIISVHQKVNIVAAVDTNTPVTANFYGASLEQALDWVLAPLGFAWTFDGRVYTVVSAADYALQAQPLVHEVFRPNYISAAELARFLTQFLSPQGRIVLSDAPGAGIPSGADEAGGMNSNMPETVVVVDNAPTIEMLRGIVAELDGRPRQVLVEATIIEVRLDETNKFGVDINLLGGHGFDSFESLLDAGQVYSDPATFVDGGLGNGSTAAGAPFLTPDSTSSFGQSGFADQGDGVRIGYVGSNIAIFLQALQTVADTNVLANTKVLALNKMRGELIIGGRLGYFGGTTVSDGISQQTVEFLEVGTQLRFRPYISNDGFVRLEIHPQRSSGVVDPTTGLPTEATSEVTTNVMVRDGETVVLGGLIESRDVSTTKRVPFLGYLPAIGWLFSSEETEVQRNEIIVLLTPHILDNGETYEDGETIIEDTRDKRDQLRKNMGPVARVEQAHRTLEEARAALDAGDLDEARLLCDRSLLLDPLADGAIDLSQEIDARLAEQAAAMSADAAPVNG